MIIVVRATIASQWWQGREVADWRSMLIWRAVSKCAAAAVFLHGGNGLWSRSWNPLTNALLLPILSRFKKHPTSYKDPKIPRHRKSSKKPQVTR